MAGDFMDGPQTDRNPRTESPTPEALLDAIRDHPGWDDHRRAEVLDHLVARFPPGLLVAAARERLRDLSGHDGEAVLRLVEALATPDLLRELAEAIVAQPD